MFLDRLKKGYEICTSKSIDEINADIQFRTQRQKENKFTLVYEPVKYKRFIITDNTIIVERQPGFFNPFAGFGTIIFNLEIDKNGTKIRCSIDPRIRYYLVSFCIFSLIPIIMSLTLIFSIQRFSFGSAFFILLIWLSFIGVCYLALLFNRFNLINYSKTILYDLELLKSA